MEIQEAKKIVKHMQDWIDPIGKNSIAIDTILAHVTAPEADLQAKGERVAELERFVRSLSTFSLLGKDDIRGDMWAERGFLIYNDDEHKELASGTDCLDALDNMNAANTGEGEKDGK